MAAIVYQTDKRSGITYAYESISHWDKEKKQSRSKRKLIGRVNPNTKEIVPTDGRCKSPPQCKYIDHKSGTVPTTYTTRNFYGATYLFDQIGNKLGITEDLKQCFPDTYKQILSIAYYLILEENNPLFRFEKWSSIHKHPHGENILSQRSSELFASITEEANNNFFRLQGRRGIDKEFWAYDTTSISSMSETLRQVQYGKNKEDDRLPQLNLALVFGEKSNLPFYYRKLPGNIPDSKTVCNLLAELDVLGFSKTKLVMDRGFYSELNINALIKEHVKFLIGIKVSLAFVKKELDKIYDDFRSFECYSEKYGLYSHTVQFEWSYTQERPYKKDVLKSTKRMYLHLYYNIEKAAEDETCFDKKLMCLRQEVLDGKKLPEHEKLYKKYFHCKTTPIRGTQVTVITEAVKERLNMRRMLVSSEKSLDGKLFIEFIALIYLSYIKKQMQDNDLYKTYTLQGALDKLDIIECYEDPGMKLRVSEVLEKQKKLYIDLGVTPPTSL